MSQINLEDAFILFGPDKSGTTFLQMITRSHPDLYCRSEDMIYTLYSNLSSVLNGYNGGLKLFDKNTAQVGPDYFTQADADELLRYMLYVMVSKSDCFGHGSKSGIKSNEIFTNFNVIKRIFPEVKFVCIVRDPRDRAVSGWFHRLRTEPNFNPDEFDINEYTIQICSTWATILEGIHLAVGQNEEPESRTLFIKYESLIHESDEAYARLFDYLGVRSDANIVANSIEETSFQNMSKGRKPGEEDAKSFMRKGIAGDWQNHINNAVNQRILDVAGATMSRYGYQ